MNQEEPSRSITDLLVAISGASPTFDKRIRRRSAALGAVVVLNSLLVTASLMILVQSALGFWPLSLVVGAFSGLAMLMWLHMIVSVLDRARPSPRAALGFLAIGITGVISFGAAQPLVMTVFSEEITAQVTTDNATQLRTADQAIAANPRYGDAAIEASRSQLDDLSSRTITQPATNVEINANPRVQAARTKLEELYQKLSALPASLCEPPEACPTPSATSNPLPVGLSKPALPAQAGGIARELSDRWPQLSNDLDASRQSAASAIKARHAQVAQLNLAKFKIAARHNNALRAEQRQRLREARQMILSDQSLPSRYLALGEIRHRYPAANAEYWLLTVFLVVVGSAVVPLKLLERSRYLWKGHALAATWS